MASPIRIKDISRTVTTAAANEYLAVDGPSGSGKMLTPDPRGTATTTAAAAVAGAYGSAPVFTTAQLLALTAGNRPPVAYCSDCLVPEGVGSPVVWNGSSWVCTCSSIPATTDVLTYFRALVKVGKDHFAEKGVFTRIAPLPYGVAPFNAGSGATRGILGDGESITLSTGTTTTGASSNSGGFTHAIALGAGDRRSVSLVYSTSEVFISAASSPTDAFSVHHALIAYGDNPATLSANAIGLYYDPQNTQGIGSLGSTNWLAVTRSGSVQSLTDTGVSAEVTSYATRHRLEILATLSVARFFIDGTEITPITTNITAVSLRPSVCIAKGGAGTTSRTVTACRTFAGCRYSA